MLLRTSILVLLLWWWTSTAVAACRVSVIPMAFGNYDPTAASALTVTGTVNVTCNANVAYIVRLDSGANSLGSFDHRAMREPINGGLMYYNLYLDATLTQVWGDGTGNTTTATGSGTGSSQLLPIYGRIPSRQNISPGNYSDAVTVTVSW